jgi:ABC-type Zn2+ transport system substrate-binding protein/surface adhesin
MLDSVNQSSLHLPDVILHTYRNSEQRESEQARERSVRERERRRERRHNRRLPSPPNAHHHITNTDCLLPEQPAHALAIAIYINTSHTEHRLNSQQTHLADKLLKLCKEEGPMLAEYLSDLKIKKERKYKFS